MSRGETVETRQLARRIRLDALLMTSRGRSSHVGSVLGLADILAVLYGGILQARPESPDWDERDRVILSKGHAGAGVYAALAETGYFPVQWLEQHCADGSKLSGHVSHKGIPGVEFSTGSLGHGLSVSAGMALGGKYSGSSFRVFCILSDGECDEGSVWEAAMFAAHHRLTNLVAIVDYNKLQSLASVAETLNLEPFADKWRSFGWNVLEVDGHNHMELSQALAVRADLDDRPTVVLAHTVKGKGVSFMENSVLWHYRSPQGDEYQAAMEEVSSS